MKHLLDGHGKVAYALVRPPGHHAQPSQADGYCFLNNAGLAVQLALDSGCKKVAVIDIDVHYGNGTAEGFYSSDKVLTVSLHMNHGSWGPSHPQSGSIDELGDGKGYGYNLNIPLPNGTGDNGYVYAFNELVVPSIHKFEPDMIVLVVGQDSSAVSYSIYPFLFCAISIYSLIVISFLLTSFCRLAYDFYGMDLGHVWINLFEFIY
jgi:acetoin utilization deacetylase AcuC-like enzyme